MNKKIVLIIFFTLLIFASCGKNKPEDNVKTKNGNSSVDTGSVRIDYNLMGKASGMIVIIKKGTSARIDLSKSVSDSVKANESRFIHNGYVYSFYTGMQGIKPIRQLIIKDHNYHKNFSSFIEADQFITNMQNKGTEQVSGYQCTIYANPQDGSMYWVFDDKYVLKASFDGVIIQAIKFEQSYYTDSAYVLPPKDIIFEDLK